MPLETPLQAFGGEPVDEAAFLSDSAYASDLQSHLRDGGWALLNFPDTKSGYYQNSSTNSVTGEKSEYSVAFAAVKGDTLAISFRGSYAKFPTTLIQNPLTSLSQTDLSQLLPDYQAAATRPRTHYNNMVPFIKEVINYASSNLYPIVKKLLVTGHSLGGQTAELFAAQPSGKDEYGNDIGAVNLGNFQQPKDISVITFESPGIPNSASNANSPLGNRVFDYYNTQDPVYSILVGPRTISHPWGEGYVHLGNQRPFNEAKSQGLPLDLRNIVKVHNDTYQIYSKALSGYGQPYPLAASLLSKYVSPDANYIFGEEPGQVSTAKIDTTTLGLPQKPNVFITLGGNEEVDGGAGLNVFEVLDPAWLRKPADTGPGSHLLVTSRLSNPAAGNSTNVFIIEGGKNNIAGFDLSKDALWLPTFTGKPAVGHLSTSGTIIDFTGMDQKPASIYLQDVDLSSALPPWLQWTA